ADRARRGRGSRSAQEKLEARRGGGAIDLIGHLDCLARLVGLCGLLVLRPEEEKRKRAGGGACPRGV
ncbi:unnamed protein product, partial [Urochloa humidicola]